jgi:hypothetical protein
MAGPQKGPLYLTIFSFGVESEKGLWELKDKLEAARCYVSDAIDHGFIHSIYAYDPNGIPPEFSHSVESINYEKIRK